MFVLTYTLNICLTLKELWSLEAPGRSRVAPWLKVLGRPGSHHTGGYTGAGVTQLLGYSS